MTPQISHRRPTRSGKPSRVAAWILAAAVLAVAASPAYSQSAKSAKPGFAPIWSKSVEPLIALELSPQGGYVGLLTRGGKLALWNADHGTPIWSQPGVAEHNLVVSDKQGIVLTYDQMNRLDPTVTLFRTASAVNPAQPGARPTRIFRRSLDGAVWTAAVSHDGSYAACGTGSRKVYLLQLKQRPRMTSFPIDGICNDLQFATSDEYMAIGLWNQSGVETMDMNGLIQGSPSGANNRRYSVSISPDSRNILTVSYRNPQSSDPVISLVDRQGTVLWSRALGKSAYAASIALGMNAQISFASYTVTVRRGRARVPERRLMAIGPKGDPLWTHPGGPFFSLTLIGLTPDGLGLIAYDGNQTLYLLSSREQVVAHYKLSAPLQYWASDADHKRLLVYTSDGALSLISVQ